MRRGPEIHEEREIMENYLRMEREIVAEISKGSSAEKIIIGAKSSFETASRIFISEGEC